MADGTTEAEQGSAGAARRRPGLEPLRRGEKLGLAAFLLLVVAFGVVVEIRSALLQARRTDLGVYLRAAWAVRAGYDPYTVPDERGWHYCYPPAFAILLAPLADAPTWDRNPPTLPFAVSVAIWYAFSVLCVFLTVHWFASALERASPDPAVRDLPPRCRRWWYTRMIPVYVCLGPVGFTLARGQVNMLLLMLVAGMFAAAMRGHRLRSGLWLAGAICLKIIPGFLVLFPLWRRDARALAGVALGLFVGLGVLPAAVWGVEGAVAMNRRMVDVVMRPALGGGGDRTLAKELIEMGATDNQSFQAVLHALQHGGDRYTRPTQQSALTRGTHWLVGAGLTLGVLLAAGRPRAANPARMLVVLGCLVAIMFHVSPSSHMHYYCLTLPLVMGLLAVSAGWRGDSFLPDRGTLLLVMTAAVMFTLPLLPGWDRPREAGLGVGGTLLLLLAGIRCLARREAKATKEAEPPESVAVAKAA